MGIIEDTLGVLSKARERTDACLVAFSGGKDALATLDLCTRTFPRVEAFYMYYAPDLEWVNARLNVARDRWGVTIHMVPHWSAVTAKSYGVYCDFTPGVDPHQVSFTDTCDLLRADTGIRLIATGAKATDGVWRKRWMSTSASDEMIWPLQKWTKFDVLGYLKARNIPRPDGDSKRDSGSGEGLASQFLCWFHDKYPEDFKRLEAQWKYCRAAVKRRDWYGVS